MNVFFDLDGTLIDSKPRLYNLFKKLVPISNLTFDEYWDLKSNKIGHQEILASKYNYSNEMFREFNEIWMNQIETKQWLDFDKPFHGITEFLMDFKKNNHSLFIVTARQSEVFTLKQIDSFGWNGIFKKVLVTQQKTDKVELIKNENIVLKEDWIIGDTGKDIETGKKLGINTAAVLSGFLNRKSLLLYNPDKIIDNVLKFNIK